MQADMRNVAFYYRKKAGITKIKDSGIAEVLLGGEGLSVRHLPHLQVRSPNLFLVQATIELHSTTRDPSSLFNVHSVRVKVSSLKFAIRGSHYDFVYKTLRPLATVFPKKQVEMATKDALITGLEYVDGQLVAVRDCIETAKATEGQSRTDVLKDVCLASRLFSLFFLVRPDIFRSVVQAWVAQGRGLCQNFRVQVQVQGCL